MSRREKHLFALAAWTALFLLLGTGAWELLGGQLMLFAFLVLSWIIYAGYAFFSRCPGCRTPVLLRSVNLFGAEIYLWSILTPRACRRCGEPL